MKQNRSRLIALLLAMCLLVGALPTLALADDAILTMDDYQNARNRVEEALAAPDVPVEQTNQHYVARSSEVESIVKSTVTGDLSVDSATAFALPVAGRLVLRAPEAEAYRWQIRVGDQWANIVGDTESEMVLTYAKLQNALSGNAAVVRCALTRAGETVYTAEATVTVDPNVETETTTVTEQIPVMSYYQPSAVSRAKELNEGVMAANDRPTPSTYTIIINYQFKDGKQAAPSWSATVATGSTYTQDIQSPVVVGYTPSEAVVHVDTSEAKTYNVTYQPAEVEFTVKHYQQNVSNDEYTLADTETKKGYTESAVGAGLAKTDYTGFYSLLYDATPTIAADGSTVVEIKYDRYYYLMNFNLDGGYGVEPIYARFGAPIIVDTPTKPGYTFAGWDKEIAKTMPAENTSYKASWTIGDQAKVTVVVWGENANDEGYSFYKNAEIMAKPGQKLTLENLQGKLICGKEEHTHSDACGIVCTHTHSLTCYGLSQNASSTNPNDETASWCDSKPETYFAQLGLEDGYLYYDDENALFDSKDNYYLRYGGKYYNLDGWQFENLKGTEVGNTSDNTYRRPDYYYKYEVKTSGMSCPHQHSDNCYACGKIAHTHTSACYYNTSFMEEPELWTLVRSDEVTVAADGTTILNVYYDRVEFTLTFKDKNKTVKTITEKWGKNISEYWPIVGNNGKTYNNGERWEPSDSTTYQLVLVYIDIMPAESFTLTVNKKNYHTYNMHYMTEVLLGENGTQYDGKTFLEKKLVRAKYKMVTEAEDFISFEGFTKYKSNPAFNSQGEITSQVDNVYFYYTRNSYLLSFYNYNTELTDKQKSVLYEDLISKYAFTPEYPDGLEPNAYFFEGWYTDQFFKNKVSDTTKMPADKVMLYAKWVPKTHTVKTWLTDKKDTPVNVGNTNEQTIAHGMQATEPEKPTNGNYTFVGWFYTENGEEKAFDFSMPVNRDLNLYAKWNSDSLVSYTIKYELENGTQIAPPTTGSALAGSTKTFDAKTGTQLNEGYQSGYFPKVSSHSLTMNIEGGNEYTFVYVAKQEVEYTVKYLEKGTEAQLADPKIVTTSKAVVTETFKQIESYAPDAYQKRLVLAAEGNEIIFWYTKDNTHAPVQTIHWIQNIEGDGYTEYQSSTNLNGVIGQDYNEAPLDIPGFTYNAGKSNASDKLTAAGLVLNLYYDRIEYPYAFKFLEQGTNKELATSVTGNARYQAQVTQTAKPIPGYTLTSADNQAINIAIEDPAGTASKNVKTFYYTEQTVDINYEVVGPTGCGTLDNYQESQLKVTTGEVKGSTPTAASGFKFVGWYKDEACTEPVAGTWVDVANNKLTPQKTKDLGNDVKGYEGATYYAKFEYDVADLTITKQGCQGIDENQSFIFDVTGPGITDALKVVIKGNNSVIIKGLKVGTYTVTEVTSWSWRYEPANNASAQKKITLNPRGAEENELIFMNDRTETKWLGGDAYSKNVFGDIGNN